jgi:hypothetical protein
MSAANFPFRKVFTHTGSDFSATTAAEKWLKEKGFSIGTMCSPMPRLILQGDHFITKWKNLSHDQQYGGDGFASATDWRTGEVTVHLKVDPDGS